MNVYKIGSHYVRAHSAQAARLRAFKVWGAQDAARDIGQQAPDVGRLGYAQAVATRDIMPTKAAHNDRRGALVGFYMASHAKTTRTDSAALALLALLA